MITLRPAFALMLALSVSACGGGTETPTSPSPSTPTAPFSRTDLVVGTGLDAAVGRVVTVHYGGWFYDPTQPENKGRQFDSSRTPGRTALQFSVGAGQVIPGFEQGVVGMRVGGQRRVVMPPELAYGARGSIDGSIPPNATLVFDVELLDVR
jgi:FKBP-type peptidyl-prolyl cis-trans isomerase